MPFLSSRKIRSRRNKRATLRKRRALRKVRVPKSIKNYVARAINSTTETKYAMYEQNALNYNGIPSVAGDVIRVIPDVPTGDNSYQKTGLTIRARKLSTKGVIKWQPNTFSEEAVYACIWYVEDKIQKDFYIPYTSTPSGSYPADVFHCLLNNLNEPTVPTGDWNEINYRWNTKRFKIQRKMIRLTPNYASQSTTTPFVNNEGKGESMRFFSFTRSFGKKGKVLKYPYSNSLFPQNHNAYMFVSFFGNNSPTGYTTLSNSQVSLAQTSVLTFEDA